MKDNLKQNKWKILTSMLGSLLPMLIGVILWNKLPDNMMTHFGLDGTGDGTSSKAFAVFGLPAIMAAINGISIIATVADPRQKDQSKKALGMVFWIMPIISIMCCGMMYSVALGKTVGVELLTPALLALMFLIFGNYLPKVKQNSTLGLKIKWTLCNEENWNLTHRFTGKVWFIGGIVMLIAMLLPTKWMIGVMLLDILAIVVLPLAYSYCIYKRHRQQGISYEVPPRTKQQKMVLILSLAAIGCILIFVLGLVFTGDITYTYTDSSLQVTNSYISGVELAYEDIDEIELRQNFDFGVRGYGFGSARLAMGVYQNDEFEAYTLYAYNSCETVVLVRAQGKVLVLNCGSAEETRILYDTLMTKVK